MLPNLTYSDTYITDGNKAIISLKNLYETILISDVNRPNHIIRIPIDDFFLKYRNELQDCKQLYAVPQSHFHKPKMTSLELYETTELWLALLRLNRMRNITEYNQSMIMIYNPSELKELINIFFKREKKIT